MTSADLSTANPALGIRHEERERELVEIARLAREVAEQHTAADHEVFLGELVQDRRPSRWLIALAAGAAGVAAGLLLAVVLIPEQPDRILVPVPERVPSMRVDQDDGVQA